MSVTLKIDTGPMRSALQAYYPTTQKSLTEIINQRTLNIVGRAFDYLPPSDIPGKRSEIQTYLRLQLSQRIRLTPARQLKGGGIQKARFVKKGTKNNQLQRVHLIIQARRAKAGKKGLWGRVMRSVSGEFVRRAQIGVGYVKSPLIPIIRTLNPLVQYKSPFSKTANIARWPGSAGHGFAKPATLGWNPTARIEIELRIRTNDEKVRTMLETAVQFGFDREAIELMAHVQKKMQQDADRINARKA